MDPEDVGSEWWLWGVEPKVGRRKPYQYGSTLCDTGFQEMIPGNHANMLLVWKLGENDGLTRWSRKKDGQVLTEDRIDILHKAGKPTSKLCYTRKPKKTPP